MDAITTAVQYATVFDTAIQKYAATPQIPRDVNGNSYRRRSPDGVSTQDIPTRCLQLMQRSQSFLYVFFRSFFAELSVLCATSDKVIQLSTDRKPKVLLHVDKTCERRNATQCPGLTYFSWFLGCMARTSDERLRRSSTPCGHPGTGRVDSWLG